MNPSWSKGYARKGAALHGARKFDEAIAAYEEGLKLEDSPALRKGLQEVQDAKCKLRASHCALPLILTDIVSGSSADADAFGMAKMFADPNLIGKLALNPRTQKHLSDPAFVQKVRQFEP